MALGLNNVGTADGARFAAESIINLCHLRRLQVGQS